jgi:hypothetical protein
MSSKSRLSTSLFALLATLVLAAPAVAQTPTDDMYKEFSPRTAIHDPSSSLPFSGLELSLLILAGVIVLATGLLLRRASRSG